MINLSHLNEADADIKPPVAIEVEVGDLLHYEEEETTIGGLESYQDDPDYLEMVDLSNRADSLNKLSAYIASTNDISRPIVQKAWEAIDGVAGIEEFGFDMHPNTFGLESDGTLGEKVKEKAKEVAKSVARKAVEVGKKAGLATGRFLAKRLAKVRRALEQDENLSNELLTAFAAMSGLNKRVTEYFNAMPGSEKVAIKLAIDKKIDKIVGSYSKKELSKEVVGSFYGSKPGFLTDFTNLLDGLDMDKNGLKKLASVDHSKLAEDDVVSYLQELHKVLSPINERVSDLLGKVSDALGVSKAEIQVDRVKKDYVVLMTGPDGLKSILEGVKLDSFDTLNKTEDFMNGLSEVKKTDGINEILSEVITDIRAHADLAVKSYGLQMNCLKQVKHCYELLEALTKLRIRTMKSFLSTDAERAKDFENTVKG